MSRDKQTEIEKFSIDLQNVSEKASKIIMEEAHEFVSQNHRYNSLKDFHEAHPKGRFQMEAEFLAELGYRKSTDVAEEIFAEIEKIIEVDKFGEAKFDIRELYKIEQKYEREGEK